MGADPAMGADPMVGDPAGLEPSDQGWAGHVEHRSGLAGGEHLIALGYDSMRLSSGPRLRSPAHVAGTRSY